jgi:hypothetical protein
VPDESWSGSFLLPPDGALFRRRARGFTQAKLQATPRVDPGQVVFFDEYNPKRPWRSSEEGA